MDEASWAALTAALTVAGAIWTWVAFRRRGAANGLRALGFTLLPAAAWLTGTLELFTEVVGSVGDWAAGLVLNPLTWAGIVLSGMSVVLWVVSGVLRDRQLARGLSQGEGTTPGRVRGSGSRQLPGRASGSKGSGGGAPVDDELAEIEALLRKRGIE